MTRQHSSKKQACRLEQQLRAHISNRKHREQTRKGASLLNPQSPPPGAYFLQQGLFILSKYSPTGSNIQMFETYGDVSFEPPQAYFYSKNQIRRCMPVISEPGKLRKKDCEVVETLDYSQSKQMNKQKSTGNISPL